MGFEKVLLKKSVFFFLLSSIVLLISCNSSDYYPKPRGYFRIDLPEKQYQLFDTTFPYRFEYPAYAIISFDNIPKQYPYWLNIYYPAYNARIHVSYRSLQNSNLYDLQEDTREMVFKHAPKAIGIKESFINKPLSKTYGVAYTIQGKDAASPFQFYLTDSTNHFLRGALYFNVSPNNDSLEPVIQFIIDDIDHLVATFSWKDEV